MMDTWKENGYEGNHSKAPARGADTRYSTLIYTVKPRGTGDKVPSLTQCSGYRSGVLRGPRSREEELCYQADATVLLTPDGHLPPLGLAPSAAGTAAPAGKSCCRETWRKSSTAVVVVGGATTGPVSRTSCPPPLSIQQRTTDEGLSRGTIDGGLPTGTTDGGIPTGTTDGGPPTGTTDGRPRDAEYGWWWCGRGGPPPVPNLH